MIHFSHVSKYYDEHRALHDISFKIDRGELVFLTGHSGAGKTTLMKLIVSMERPTRGQILVNGRHITRLHKYQIPPLRREIGIIFQNPQLIQSRRVFENVALPLHLSGYRLTEIKRRVRAALDKVGLLNKEKCYPASLSVGEQQRIGIARAIVNKPVLLLADEPTGNLDPELSREIVDLLAAFNAVGVTTLVATHDLALISTFNHRMIILKSGRLSTQ